MIPQAGSAYAYSYATLGEIVAWIIGWDLILEYAVGNVAVAISWGDYFKSLTGGLLDLPVWLTTGYRTALLSSDPGVHGLLAVGAARRGHPDPDQRPGVRASSLLITWLLLRGVRESARANNIMVAVKLLVLGALHRRSGCTHINPANYTRSRRTASRGIHQGAAIVFFAYIGFDAISHGGGRDEESAAQPADRHSRRTRDLYGHLHHHRCGAHRAWCRTSELGKLHADPLAYALNATGMTSVALARRARRGVLDGGGAARLPVRPAAHLLRDGARRPAAAAGRRRSAGKTRVPYVTTMLTGVVRRAVVAHRRRGRDVRPDEHRNAVRRSRSSASA